MPSNESEGLRVTPTLRIPLDEVEIRSTTSGGPGGQHANRARTRIEVSFDVEQSRVLSEAQRERLREQLGVTVTAASSDERSQYRNRELALERLTQRLAGALRVDPPRRPTRPTKASVRRRLDAKRRTSVRKADRRSPPGD
jgi:ribosome-associated protein